MVEKKMQEEFKQQLESEKKRLEEELARLANKGDDEEYDAKFEDFGRSEEDNAEEVENYAANLSITETLEKNLKDVNDALERIENDTYGICENCNKNEIKIERLKAYPAARLCMECAQENQ